MKKIYNNIIEVIVLLILAFVVLIYRVTSKLRMPMIYISMVLAVIIYIMGFQTIQSDVDVYTQSNIEYDESYDDDAIQAALNITPVELTPVISTHSRSMQTTRYTKLDSTGIINNELVELLNDEGDHDDEELIEDIEYEDVQYGDYPGREHISPRSLNFILKVAPGVQATMDCGVLPSIRIAQAIIESGWGESSLTIEANNLFGMRAFSGWTGKRVTKRTGEFSDGGSHYITADFRAYDSWEDSIADQANNYTRLSNYKNSGLLGEVNYIQAAIKLGNSGYASNPKYADSIIHIINKYDLTYFDNI